MHDNGVCRTAPATPGLLIILTAISLWLKMILTEILIWLKRLLTGRNNYNISSMSRTFVRKENYLSLTFSSKERVSLQKQKGFCDSERYWDSMNLDYLIHV